MNERIKYFIYACVFILAIIVLNFGYNFLNKRLEEEDLSKQNVITEEKKIDRTATDFTVYTENNEEILLSSYKGKPIVINFWTTWCVYCKVEMPYFNDVYQKEKENVSFLMINETIDDKKEDAINYIKSEKYEFPVYYDTKGNAASAYKVTGYPVTIFINKDFEIYKIHQGAISEDTLQKYIDQIK